MHQRTIGGLPEFDASSDLVCREANEDSREDYVSEDRIGVADPWRTSYPPSGAFRCMDDGLPVANANEWQTRLYIRLATTIVIGLVWGVLALWLLRQRQRGGSGK
jgi:hypothetical protein